MPKDAAKRAEWLLMYRQGLEPSTIARLCHTIPGPVEDAIWAHLKRHPEVFDQRLTPCNQPALPAFTLEDTSRGWDGNYLFLRRFLDACGRHPRRDATKTRAFGALQVFLYRWHRGQRRESDQGNLRAAREKAMEEIPGWVVLGRDQMHAQYWDARMRDCADFITEHGRISRYRDGPTERGRSLGSWLPRQLAKQRRGMLTAARAATLDAAMPAGTHPCRRRLA